MTDRYIIVDAMRYSGAEFATFIFGKPKPEPTLAELRAQVRAAREQRFPGLQAKIDAWNARAENAGKGAA